MPGCAGPLLWLGYKQVAVLTSAWQESLRELVAAGGYGVPAIH